MKRWMTKVALFASLGGGVLAAGGSAMAHSDASTDSPEANSRHGGHHGGLFERALTLDSLSGEQRASIEKLVEARRAAREPAREAEAQVLTALAQQVEAGAVDKNALSATVQTKKGAEESARSTERELTMKLHAVLTPTQRGQLVDAIEAAHHEHRRDGRGAHPEPHGDKLARLAGELGLSAQQEQQIASNLKAEGQEDPLAPPSGAKPAHEGWLESFRSETFQPRTAPDAPDAHAERRHGIERWIEAAVPVLTQAQRVELASHLRARAAREHHS